MRALALGTAHLLCAALVLGACAGRQPYADGRGLVGQLEREVIALKQQRRQLEERAATCGDASESARVYPELVQVFAGSEVKVQQVGARVALSMPEAMLFSDPFALTFRDEATMALDLLATTLQVHPALHVTVEGHTDDSLLPDGARRWYRSKMELSFHQALAVAERLEHEFKLDKARFSVTAFGEQLPVESNDLPSGQARNRRVVVQLGPAPQPL